MRGCILKHLDGIANYCRTKVRMGVVEAVNGNIRMLINRGRGYQNLRYYTCCSRPSDWPSATSNSSLGAGSAKPRSLPTLSDSRSERFFYHPGTFLDDESIDASTC